VFRCHNEPTLNPLQASSVQKRSPDTTMTTDVVDTLDREHADECHPAGEVVPCSGQSNRVAGDCEKSACHRNHVVSDTENVADASCCAADGSQTETNNDGNHIHSVYTPQ